MLSDSWLMMKFDDTAKRVQSNTLSPAWAGNNSDHRKCCERAIHRSIQVIREHNKRLLMSAVGPLLQPCNDNLIEDSSQALSADQ